jgi:hypothetical protein
LVFSNEEGTLGVFENRVLRKLFGPKRDEVIRDWSKLLSGELYDSYSSVNIFQVIKTRRMGWAVHVARMDERIGTYKALVRKPERKSHLKDIVVDRRLILKWILNKWIGERELD